MALAPSSVSLRLPRCEAKPLDPNTEAIKQRLIRKGVVPTPKILHALRKKELQKSLRKAKKQALNAESPRLSDAQKQVLEEEARLRAARAEYRAFKEDVEKRRERVLVLSGRPWERLKAVDLRGIWSYGKEDLGDGRLKREHLVELREMLEKRNAEEYEWLLDDDVEEARGDEKLREWKKSSPKGLVGDEEKIKWLIERLTKMDLNMKDWKFPRLMKQSGLYLSEVNLLKLIEGFGVIGNWKHALSVVEWAYNEKKYRYQKSRSVYTKLLAILGKGGRPSEALRIFNIMRDDGYLYPDMAAFHAIAVCLGQAGLVKDLISIIECMRQKPSKKIKNMKLKDRDQCLEPDIVIFNALLNACIPTHQWKGVFWVLKQIRSRCLEPNGATYGLAMEVMLKSRKYDFVHHFFGKMQKSGLATKALTYKVLVRAFWEEGKVDEAIRAVRDMEQRGVVGIASVYYELACCLCNEGRWQEAVMEVEKLRRLPLAKPLEVTFTGMILSAVDGGYISDCISIFEYMNHLCTPNIGTINAMLKAYGCSDMFAKAKELFESTEEKSSDLKTKDNVSLKPDEYTYSSMLEISASAHQWEYFEHVYKEMALCGYQFDPKKHAHLLLEASRAGKCHLLEHAFDTVLESGEIPHISFFIEMICQTIAHQNFQKTAVLINSMAHASMQVNESQWLNLFERNKDRLSKDTLLNLLYNLNKSNLVMEDPVPNFLKALQSLAGLSLLESASRTSDSSYGSAYKLLAYPPVENLKCCEKMLPTTEKNGNLESHEENTISSDSQGNGLTVLHEESENEFASCMPYGTDGEILDSILYESSDYSDTEIDIDLLSHDGPCCSDLPTASEILEAWREDQLKDGGFPFQN
ncbi:hypothetical protein J5N97_000384 [Dioscorea zingiberensis]|uniref:Pentatricopeptide repeat-containing protein n=1 Tax=Dioscorea zingiberensis TaxID=325984 RepID=A0A9D5H313_9LILI|nr:hypothetical protein J5N97_000384 [Dioscorea zingiberensis]